MNNIYNLNASIISKLNFQLSQIPYHPRTTHVVGSDFNEPSDLLHSKIISSVLHVNSANKMGNTLYSIYSFFFKTDQKFLETFLTLYPYSPLGTNFNSNLNMAKNIIKDSVNNPKVDNSTTDAILYALMELSNLADDVRKDIYSNILNIVHSIDSHVFIDHPFVDSINLCIDTNGGMSIPDDQLVDTISMVDKYGSITIKDNNDRLMLVFKDENNQISACELESIIHKFTAA